MIRINFKMKLKLATLALLFLSAAAIAQPPPPPPPGSGPPCWPPPCIPVDNGIFYAIGAAVIFGGYWLYRSYRMKTAR